MVLDREWWELNTSTRGERFTSRGTFHANFSNFMYSPIEIDGKLYRTVEHYFQSQKTLDPKWREDIRLARTPGKAKVLGRSAPLRPDWDTVKYQIMLTGLWAKFVLPEFRSSLANFVGNIVEWNSWHDVIWGVCVCDRCEGTGQNLLGKALEQIREELRAETPSSED